MTTNTALFKTMIDRYNELSYTHEYIFGFTYQHNVYAVYATADVLPYILMLDKASRGAGYALRFRPTREQKNFLMSLGAQLICSKEWFDRLVADSRYNKGEIFEKIITEKAGQRWHKDSTRFDLDGDLTVNGIAYQIKYESATFTNERILARL